MAPTTCWLLEVITRSIAQIEEALGDVNNEQGEDGESMLAAIDSYQKVIDLNESEAMVERAEERIAALKKPETREFIAWFSKQDFSPTNDPSLPPSTLPGGSEIPGLPDLDLSLPALDLGGESTPETPKGRQQGCPILRVSLLILQPQKKQPQKKRPRTKVLANLHQPRKQRRKQRPNLVRVTPRKRNRLQLNPASELGGESSIAPTVMRITSR